MRHEPTEQWLRDEHAPFTYVEELSWNKFDIPLSRRNQARVAAKNGLLEEVVANYAAAMGQGRQFPAVVAYEGKRGYVLIDGNQRQAAAERAKCPATDVYLVQSDDPRLLDGLTRAANTINGQPPLNEERLEHAKYFHKVYGTPIVEIARSFNISFSQLNAAIRGDETRQRLGTLGVEIPEARGLRDTRSIAATCAKLASIHSDPVLKEAAQLIFEARLSSTLVDELLGLLRQARSEQAQLVQIAQFRTRPDVQDTLSRMLRGKATPRSRPSVQSLILGHLVSLQNLLGRAETLSALGFSTPEARSHFHATLEHMLKRIEALQANEPALPTKMAF